MTELTQKLLRLDSQTDNEVKKSNKLAQEMMVKADIRAKELMDEAGELLEKQKQNDLKILSENLEKKALLAIDVLEKRKREFDENFDITKLVERLITVAKEKVCP